MSLVSILCFTIFILSLSSIFVKNSDIFSPARLFILLWSFIVGLTDLKFSGLQIEWSAYGWGMLLICLLSMLIGMYIVFVINFNRPLYSIASIRNTILNRNINKKQLFKLILILFLTYSFSYFVIYLMVGYIPLFTADPNAVRTKWSVFGFGLIIHSAPAVIYFIILFVIFVKRHFFIKMLLVFFLLITFFSFLLLLQRFTLVITIVLSITMLYYGTKKFKTSYISFILLVLVLLIYSVSTLRTSRYFILYLYNDAKIKFDKELAFLTEPYMYLTMNLENFANSVDKLDTFSYGYFTFDFVLALTGLKHWIAENYYFQEYPFIVNKSFNTYTMFFVYYRDFGVIGLFVFPFIIGFVISSIYYWMRRKPNIHSISLYGMVVFVILFTFFIPMLSWLHFAMNISLLFFCSKYLVTKQIQIE